MKVDVFRNTSGFVQMTQKIVQKRTKLTALHAQKLALKFARKLCKFGNLIPVSNQLAYLIHCRLQGSGIHRCQI